MAATDADVKAQRDENAKLRAELQDLRKAQVTDARAAENDVKMDRLNHEADEMRAEIERLRSAAKPADALPTAVVVTSEGRPEEPVLVKVPDQPADEPAAQVAVEGADIAPKSPSAKR